VEQNLNDAPLDAEDHGFSEIWRACSERSTISFARALCIFRVLRYVHQNFLAGDIVDIGSVDAGSLITIAKTAQLFGDAKRRLLFVSGNAGEVSQSTSAVIGDATHDLDGELRTALADSGYDETLVSYHQQLEELLTTTCIQNLALLRLEQADERATSWALQNLYPHVVEDGVMILEQFGSAAGQRKAADAYLDSLVISGETRPFLHLSDETGRIAVKPSRKRRSGPVRRYDYHPPGLKRAELLGCFPELVARDAGEIDWIYLRREVPHIWRSDSRARREPNTGAISVEEAELLYNNALPFTGNRGLEVGCHYGWSTAHLVKAGLLLDVVDPALGDDHHLEAVTTSLARVGGPGTFSLWPGYSPGIIKAVAASAPAAYSFAFIDGLHEGPAPRRDAEAVAEEMAADAIIMFHDLTSPYVAAGLEALANAGWKTGIYNTMQIMGVAWRGSLRPVEHVADPNVPWPCLSHLNHFHMLSVPQTDCTRVVGNSD
jgi:hypothetical protein